MASHSPGDIIEALLFAAEKPLTVRQMAQVVGVSEREAQETLQMLMEDRERVGGLRVVPVAGGYRMVTKPEFADYVAKLRPVQRVRLSRAALETLTIVAYRQPLTRAEIDYLRGVDSSGALETLLERKLVEIVGRKESPGRPMLFGTTQQFLDHFGLRSREDLPPLSKSDLTTMPRGLYERLPAPEGDRGEKSSDG